MNRRRFLEGTGLVAVGLVLGGCLPRGDHDEPAGPASPAALEAAAIAIYDDLLGAGALGRTATLRTRLERFRDHHRDHLRALTPTGAAPGGGDVGSRLRRAVGADLDDEEGIAVAALELESILAASYVAHVTAGRPGSSATLVAVAGIEARHATALRHHLGRDPLLGAGLYPVTDALPA